MPTPERTSNVKIVAAGRELLEESGPSKLTMQKVAERVGVHAPSLYKRVRDRDTLITAVAAATLADLSTRLENSDRSFEALAHVYRAFAHEHPEGFRLMFASTPPQDAIDRAGVAIVESMAQEVGAEHALDAARLVTAWASGFVQMELAGAFRLGDDVDAAFEYGLRALRRGLREGGDA